jgi:cold shock CspA family protein
MGEVATGTPAQGKIKWFSQEKGYGYIVGDTDQDYYFNIRDLQGADLPRNGDLVTFVCSQGKKGPRAKSVVITQRAEPTSHSSSGARGDDRVMCPHCTKKMVPRLVTYQGNPRKSLCPYCGGIYKDFGACYIATAVYGDHYAPEVIALRRFRDETLARSAPGRWFIAIYYRLSPPVAAHLSRRHGLTTFVRSVLNPLARRYD